MLATARRSGQRSMTIRSITFVLVMKAPALPCRRAISSSRLHSSSAWFASISKWRPRRARISGNMRRQTRTEGFIASSSREETNEARDRLALGDERVLDRARVGYAERHAAHQLLFVRRRADLVHDDPVERRERRLRAGVEALAARRDHDALQEHAEIEPAALAHDAVDREHQADRRPEELVVAPMLRVHALLVGLGEAEQAVQIPADLAPPLDERRLPF